MNAHKKDCFGGTPKPARGTRALPGGRYCAVFEGIGLTAHQQQEFASRLSAQEQTFEAQLAQDEKQSKR